MAEMMSQRSGESVSVFDVSHGHEGWRVQAQNAQDGKKRILMGNTADSMASSMSIREGTTSI
jgi:hypothetical protein